MEDASTPSCATALLNVWISRFGIPDHITSDRVSVFTSELWTALAKLIGTQLHHTTSYHPEANGMVQRLHRTLKAALTARCSGNKWTSHLPWVMLGLRTTPKEGLSYSAAEMVFGEPLVVPGEFFPSMDADQYNIERLRRIAGKFTPSRPTRHNSRKVYVPELLRTCQYVFTRTDAVKPSLSPAYKGPYRVIQRGEKTFQIQLENKLDWISIDRLKPAYTEDLDDHTYTRAGRLSRPPSTFDPSSW